MLKTWIISQISSLIILYISANEKRKDGGVKMFFSCAEARVRCCSLPLAGGGLLLAGESAPQRHLYIGNLPGGTKAAALRDMLADYGRVRHSTILYNFLFPNTQTINISGTVRLCYAQSSHLWIDMLHIYHFKEFMFNSIPEGIFFLFHLDIEYY